jgi:universal stress protein E
MKRGRKPIRRILVGIKDPGSRALPAVAKAARLAGAFRAELVLFHAIAVPLAAEPYLYANGGLKKFRSNMRERTLEKLGRIANRLRRQKLRVRIAADWDFPVHEAIIRQARRVKADLIVADCHSGHRFVPWLLHLTDWELLRTSPLPVLLVKSRRAWRHPTVLAAVDPVHIFAKPAALDAGILRAGAQLSRALRGSLHVMHAYFPVPAATASFVGARSRVIAQVRAATEERARQAFDRVLRATKIPRSRRHLVKGPSMEAIPRTARAVRAGIVVMGAVSRSALKRIVIGNTAEIVLGALPCDVLVVKPARFVTRVSRARHGMRIVATPEGPIPF